MKKNATLARIGAVLLSSSLLITLAACGGTSQADAKKAQSATRTISVVSREDGSGTRSAFTELAEIVDGDGNDATVSSAAIVNSTSVVLTTVASDPNAIGYVSYGSLNDTVTAVEVDGVAPSVDTIKDKSYKISRPFNIVTKDGISKQAQDFITFIMSADGQKVVEDEGYVSVDDAAKAYEAAKLDAAKVVVSGSSSVTPVMEKLAEAYKKVQPSVEIEVQQSDSSTGVQNAIDGVSEIGMASRDLKDSELAKGVKNTVIAQDGIAVIVNKNSGIKSISLDQIKQIYMGEMKSWTEVKK